MAVDDSVEILALPAPVIDRISQVAIKDAVRYFDPDLLAIPGPRNPIADAAVRDAASAYPILQPQLGRSGERVLHYRFSSQTGLHVATDAAPPAETIDVIAVQRRDVLDRLDSQLTSGDRYTGTEGATFLLVPRLSIEWNPTNLSTDLPEGERLAAIRAERPEPVVVLAGGQPAAYYHEWSIPYGHSSVSVPIAGLGATERGGERVTQYTCTAHGTVAGEVVSADRFGLRALNGVGRATADRLRSMGWYSTADVRDIAVSDLAELPGVGRRTAEKIHAHVDVIESDEPIVLTNKTPIKTRDGRPPLCLDIETDGLTPSIIWQFGIYDPATDTHRAFIETDSPKNPTPVLEAFITWLLANHRDRTLLTWNGYGFDYKYITQFLRQRLPEHVDAWNDIRTYDLYKWAVRDGNALLPGRTNKLEHVARALGYESADTGLSGAETAAAYQRFMRDPTVQVNEPDWERHRTYCEDDCRALWHVYEEITNATRRDTTDSGAGGAEGTQAGLTDFPP